MNAEKIIKILTDNGLTPARIVKNPGSVLLEYSGIQRASFDIYETGELVLAVAEGEKDIFYELVHEDTHTAIIFLKEHLSKGGQP